TAPFLPLPAPPHPPALSLHDALPIYSGVLELVAGADGSFPPTGPVDDDGSPVQLPVGTEVNLSEPDLPPPPDGYDWGEQSWSPRSEGHTSELQSRFDLVCRPLLG